MDYQNIVIYILDIDIDRPMSLASCDSMGRVCVCVPVLALHARIIHCIGVCVYIENIIML